jgi:monothiol glutaredoxin
MALPDHIKQRIEKDIKNHKVFLYMKGNPEFPQCGFSGQAVAVLQHYGVDFGSFNVLEDEEIRQGIKEYADWPTIPQLYINGEFVGGCDILMEMHESGDLKSLLEG